MRALEAPKSRDMAILVDTGILYALADRRDGWHERARRWYERTPILLLVPVTVIPEVCYLMHRRLGAAAERAFVGSLAKGELETEALRAGDLARCDELLDRYAELGFVDLSVVAMAERLKISTIATTDRNHFSRVRPRHATAFRLLP